MADIKVEMVLKGPCITSLVRKQIHSPSTHHRTGRRDVKTSLLAGPPKPGAPKPVGTGSIRKFFEFFVVKMTADQAKLKGLKIQTGVVQRLNNEIRYYTKEEQQLLAKFEKLQVC